MRLLLFLSVYFFTAEAGSIAIRQTTGSGDAGIDCNSYSTIASLATIGTNSTYRAAFLRSTTDGTNRAASILNTAEVQLLPLINDQTLNGECGNATQNALTEAATNFTSGIVGEFKIQPLVGIEATGSAGVVTVLVVIIIVFFMMGTFSAM